MVIMPMSDSGQCRAPSLEGILDCANSWDQQKSQFLRTDDVAWKSHLAMEPHHFEQVNLCKWTIFHHFPKQLVLLPKGMLLACFWQNFRPDHVTKTYRPVGSFHLVHVPTEMFTVFVLLILLQGGAAELCLLVYKPHEYSYIYHKPKNSPSYVHQLNAIIWGPYIVALLLLGRLIANLYQFVKLYFAGVHYLGQTPGWHTQF